MCNLCMMSYMNQMQTNITVHAFFAIKIASEWSVQPQKCMLHHAQLTSSALNAVGPFPLQAAGPALCRGDPDLA